MGLIKAAIHSIQGTLKDQYKEVISCDALSMDTLVKKGTKMNAVGSTNKGNDNIISDNSVVMVADGQCVLIVENGKILDFCAETGEYIWKTGGSPSMLTGGLKGLKDSFKTLWNRVQTGGGQDKNQRVYYVNLKEIMSNKVGAGDIPFRDSEFNFTMKLKCFGEYSYKITDPLMFYQNVSGNVTNEFRRDSINSQFKAEIQTALQPALGRVALKKIPYDQLPLYTKEITTELNNEITEEWVQKRGISIVTFALASVTPDAESAQKIEQFQSSRVYTDARMMGARLGEAQANALENAAKNENGAMMGIMGMGMVQQAGGMNPTQLFQMGGQPNTAPAAQPSEANPNNWKCQCGKDNIDTFCSSCGRKSPTNASVKEDNKWNCECGAVNGDNFCAKCGKKKPVILDAKCETCGHEGNEPFNFCPKCGAENKI